MRRTSVLLYLFLLSRLLFPQQSILSENVNRISEYISSREFGTLSNSTDHIRLMDTLFLKALSITDNNISEALLSLSFAAIPYRQFPVVIPLLNILIRIPLVSAGDSVFLLKNKNLPSKLFFDTPRNEYGDRDKVAHFFGNAFLGYHSGFLNFGNLPGYFVEVFEKTFKVQSEIDERDMDANMLGKAYGKALSKKFVLPSQSIILYPFIYTILQL